MPPPSRWRRLMQFRLRTLLAGMTLLLIAGNGFLIWWRTPFVVKQTTRNPGAEIVEILRREIFSNWQTEMRRLNGRDAFPPRGGLRNRK
jgi:hypothetical protein